MVTGAPYLPRSAKGRTQHEHEIRANQDRHELHRDARPTPEQVCAPSIVPQRDRLHAVTASEPERPYPRGTPKVAWSKAKSVKRASNGWKATPVCVQQTTP